MWRQFLRAISRQWNHRRQLLPERRWLQPGRALMLRQTEDRERILHNRTRLPLWREHPPGHGHIDTRPLRYRPLPGCGVKRHLRRYMESMVQRHLPLQRRARPYDRKRVAAQLPSISRRGSFHPLMVLLQPLPRLRSGAHRPQCSQPRGGKEHTSLFRTGDVQSARLRPHRSSLSAPRKSRSRKSPSYRYRGMDTAGQGAAHIQAPRRSQSLARRSPQEHFLRTYG